MRWRTAAIHRIDASGKVLAFLLIRVPDFMDR